MVQAIGEILKERNISLDTVEEALKWGFTQVPNWILRTNELSQGAKLTYSLFLSYAWHNDGCFPGQDRLAEHLGMSRPRTNFFISELKEKGFVTVIRKGQGKTNDYVIHFQVKKGKVHSKVEFAPGQNIHLDTIDPTLRGGFTQIPNLILRDRKLSLGAKLVFCLFLSYAWHNDYCYPGQDRLAADIGLVRSRVTAFLGELAKEGFIDVDRKGQGKKNDYTLHFHRRTPDLQMSAGRPLDVRGLTSSSPSADFIHYKNIQVKKIQ